VQRVTSSKTLLMFGSVVVTNLIYGCSFIPESNETACSRAMEYSFSCLLGSNDEPNALELDEFIAMACESVPETNECDWVAFADCVTALTCEQATDNNDPASEECNILFNDLEESGCMTGDALP